MCRSAEDGAVGCQCTTAQPSTMRAPYDQAKSTAPTVGQQGRRSGRREVLEQTIRIAPRVTAFTAVCEACADACDGADGWLACRVEGRLRLDQMHAALTCSRGHSLRVERLPGRRVALSGA